MRGRRAAWSRFKDNFQFDQWAEAAAEGGGIPAVAVTMDSWRLMEGFSPT
jgi:hypothetical protein